VYILYTTKYLMFLFIGTVGYKDADNENYSDNDWYEHNFYI
jgi:hypothetical protein